MSEQQSVIDHLTERMLPLESAEHTLDRIEKYLTNEQLPPRTSIPMALAAIRKWRGTRKPEQSDDARRDAPDDGDDSRCLGESLMSQSDRMNVGKIGVGHGPGRSRTGTRPRSPTTITHGRHCLCSACARQDWAEPGLAPCGMHGPSCPPVYDPWGRAGDAVPEGRS